MAHPIEITDATFQNEVLKADKPVLIDFWAEWCGPCRMIAPSVQDIANEYEGAVIVGKVDVDSNPAIPGRYGIVGIPTLMLFKDGEVVERITGALPKDRILAQILPHLDVEPA